jgi:hypothetical protein
MAGSGERAGERGFLKTNAPPLPGPPSIPDGGEREFIADR